MMLGLFYWNQDYDQRGMMNINGALYLLLVNLTVQNSFAVVNVSCQLSFRLCFLNFKDVFLGVLLGVAHLFT